MNAAGLACVVCVGMLLVAEARGARGLRVIAKCGAALAMVLCGITAGAGATAVGRRVLLGLGLSAGGDVALLGKGRGAFMAGLVLFAAAHLAYASAALTAGASWLGALAIAAALGIPARYVWAWLSPHVPSGLRIPVLAYLGIITAMVALALAGAWSGVVTPRFAVGAVLFYLSDLAVARERFVHSAVSNRLWGLPAYFGAQLLIATSL